MEAMVGVLGSSVVSVLCWHGWPAARLKDRSSRLRRGVSLQQKHAACLPAKKETLPCQYSLPPRPPSTIGTSRHRASHAASMRAKSLSAQVKMRATPARDANPKSAISQSYDRHCVSGNAEVREARRVVAFGRPQSLP